MAANLDSLNPIAWWTVNAIASNSAAAWSTMLGHIRPNTSPNLSDAPIVDRATGEWRLSIRFAIGAGLRPVTCRFDMISRCKAHPLAGCPREFRNPGVCTADVPAVYQD